jgi:UrcA family protein
VECTSLKENAVNKVNFDRRASVWLVGLAASLACLVGSAPVLAAAPWEAHSVTVRYGDLDITTSAGAAALYQRIQAAARVTCGGYQDHALVRPPYAEHCSSAAISAAVASVNSPLLSAVHASHRGSSRTAMLVE